MFVLFIVNSVSSLSCVNQEQKPVVKSFFKTAVFAFRLQQQLNYHVGIFAKIKRSIFNVCWSLNNKQSGSVFSVFTGRQPVNCRRSSPPILM